MLPRLNDLDRSISGRLVARPEPGRRYLWLEFVHRLSQTGSYGVGWVVLFGVMVTMIDGWKLALLASGCVLGTLLVNTGIKLLIRRPRPRFNPIGHSPNSYSMPSAHTAMAVVGAAIMTVVAPALVVVWWAWTVSLAVSRVILGMHYAGDVLAGAALGALLAWFVALPLLELAGA